MNVTPKVHAQQVRRAAERKSAVVHDVRRLAFTSETGVIRPQRPEPEPEPVEDDPFCFVCGRCTDHFAEHDDLVEQGLAEYRNGNVYRL